MMYLTFVLRELFLFIMTVIGIVIFPLTYMFRKMIWSKPKLFKWLGLYWFADSTEIDFIQSWYGLYELVEGGYDEFYRMNWIQKFFLSYNWTSFRNPHWNLTMTFNPMEGKLEDIIIYKHSGTASPLTWRNKIYYGEQYATYSVRGHRYFRFSFTRDLKKYAIMRLFGFEIINFMAGAAENRFLIKLRYFNNK